MQFEDRENREQRNERPKEPARNLPMAVLLVLVGIICALLYIGWKYMSDDTSGSDDLTAVPADTVAKAISNEPEEEVSTSQTTNAPTVTEGLPEVSVPKVGNKIDATEIKEEKPKEEKPKAELLQE